MNYPIFHSFTNQIKNELTSKNINIQTFRTWNEDQINATGLEIVIDANTPNNYIKAVTINFDWDRFRETVMAQQLDGLDEHPMLQEKNLKSITVAPKIDIEISWVFDETKAAIALPAHSQEDRLEHASKWMKKISQKANRLLLEDNIITRWHLEVEGIHNKKHLSSVSLISYFQYTLTHLKSLNDAHTFITNRLRHLLVKSQKVRRIADQTLESAA